MPTKRPKLVAVTITLCLLFGLPCRAELKQALASLVIDTQEASQLRGIAELSYRSAIDGTEQPFMLAIPDQYADSRSWPLEVYLHGFGGSHRRGTPGDRHAQDYFTLSVHGRARGTAFLGLSEIDVLEAMQVVMAHWNIDRHRIHLAGSSMGGFGAFRLAARFPDRFASCRPIAASGLARPLENLIHVPTRELHGDADHSVPICLGRGSIRRLADFGGDANIEEFPGVGHGIPSDKRRPAREWALTKSLVCNVRRVHYTAWDEMARSAYWVRVTEWGGRGMPAIVDARVEDNNTLNIRLDNVTTVRFDLEDAPIDRDKSLRVNVGSEAPVTVKHPLPQFIWVSNTNSQGTNGDDTSIARRFGVLTDAPKLPERRLHYPGGSFALYHGEQLLIVRGTHGDKNINERLSKIAELASRSADGRWPAAQYRERPSAFQMTTGRLPIKADDAVTDDDLHRYNLLLLGDANQNSLVGRIHDQLPVKIEDERIRTNDGFSWDYAGRGFGLLHANPLASGRLIYWVAAQDAAFYRAGKIAPLQTMMDYQGSIEAPADFMIMDTEQRTLIAARRFNSRWNWEAGYNKSPILGQSIAVGGPRATEVADAIRETAGTDIGSSAGQDWYSFGFETMPGVTRKMDVAAMYYGDRVGLLDASGEQILKADAAFRNRERNPKEPDAEWYQMCRFVPAPDGANIETTRRYRIAFPEWAAFTFGRYSGIPTDSFQITNIYVRDAIETNLK